MSRPVLSVHLLILTAVVPDRFTLVPRFKCYGTSTPLSHFPETLSLNRNVGNYHEAVMLCDVITCLIIGIASFNAKI